MTDSGKMDADPLPINGYTRKSAIEQCARNYVFLKYIIGLDKPANILLNRHSKYRENCTDENYILGQKIHIASKIDILISEGKTIEEIKTYLKQYRKLNIIQKM